MATELQDPFADAPLPSLLPQTLASLPLPASPASDFRSFLQSMALKESEEAVTQAKEISRNKEGRMDSSQNGDEARERTQVRRPALSRKKAQFSMKLGTSVANVDTSSQIGHIEDPEEYFLAFEQQENAEKELKKLRGEVLADPFLLSPGRKRRPGISGNRRTSSYRHQFSADTAESLRASQEALPDANPSSPIQAFKLSKLNETAMEPRASSGEHPELSKDEGLVAEKENSNNLLEHLLSAFKNMNEAQSTAFLRETLQLKNIDVGKIDLPQLYTFGTNEVGKRNKMATEDRSTGDRLLQHSSATARSPVAASSRPANPFEDPSVVYPSDNAPGNSHPNEHMTSCTAHITSGYSSKSIAVIDRRFSLADKLRGRASVAHKFSDDSSDSEEDISTSKECSLNNSTKQSCHQEIDKMAVSDKHDGHMDDDEIGTFFKHPDSEVENTISEYTGFAAERFDGIVEDDHVSGTDIHFTSEGVDLGMQNEGNVMVQDKVVACAGKEELSSTIVKNVTQDDSLSGILVHTTLEGVDATMQHKDTVMVQDENEALTEDHNDHDTVMTNNLMDGLSTVESDVTPRNDQTQGAREVAAVVEKKAKKQKTGNREKNILARNLDTVMTNNLMDGLSTVESDVTPGNDQTQEARKVAAVVERKAKKQKTENREKNLHARNLDTVMTNNVMDGLSTAESDVTPRNDQTQEALKVAAVVEMKAKKKKTGNREKNLHAINLDTVLTNNLMDGLSTVESDVTPINDETQEALKVAAAVERKAKKQKTGNREKKLHARNLDTVMTNNLMDGLSTVESDVTPRNDQRQEARKVAAVVERKAKKQKIGNREKNLCAKRKSLAGAGTTWESGVRKSTRIRSRPLNFWLGERFLYGRIHDSLATVIGKKIATPEEDGKGLKLKVESFVPEKYADLISQVASH